MEVTEKEFKFKFFWNWFIEQNPAFISTKDRLPEENVLLEGIFIYEKDGLPAKGVFLYLKDKFYIRNDKSQGKFEVTHWRKLDK